MISQDPKISRVLVTGASGFVGRTLVATNAPFQWRAAVRSHTSPHLIRDSVVVGDIDGQTDWSKALSGVDCVVHLAARAHVMKPTADDRAEFDRTNILGTERLARAAVAEGVGRFVYLSSIKVNGEASGDRAFGIDDIPEPQDDYACSKLEAERRLSGIASTSGIALSIVRAPLVYGPGVRANFLRLLSLVRNRIPVPVPSIENLRSLVSVWNLCDLICSLIQHQRSISGVFMVTDGEDISTAELVRRLARMMHRPTRLVSLPKGVLQAIAALTGRSADIRRLCDSLVVDISETRSRLGWSPPVSLEAGLARTVEWYIQESTVRMAK